MKIKFMVAATLMAALVTTTSCETVTNRASLKKRSRRLRRH